MTMVEQCCNLANRKLTDYIPPTKFRSKTLILDNNEITNIRNIKYCTSLHQLSVCHNEVSDMSPVAHLPHLKLLHLIDNVIDNITGVGECGELEELNLSRNCLQSFVGLYHCTSLRKLDLSYNSIINLVDITSLTSLQELYLHGNELVTLESAPLCLPCELRVLSLADNKISDIGQLAYLTRLKSLESLSLAGNACSTFNTRPYQIFAVMCCPSILMIDQEFVTPQHREHAHTLEKKMLMSGNSSFSAVRDERPRTGGRTRSKTALASVRSKENNSSVANTSVPGSNYVPRDQVPDDQSSTYSEYSTSPNSTYSAYDEYNDRPATSGSARVRSRRSSDARTPELAPQNFPQIVVPRERSRSMFVRSPEPPAHHPLNESLEEELESESVYVSVEQDMSQCLDDTQDITTSLTSLNSTVSSAPLPGSANTSSGPLPDSDDQNTTLVHSSHFQEVSSPDSRPSTSSSKPSCPSSSQTTSNKPSPQSTSNKPSPQSTSSSRPSSKSFFVEVDGESPTQSASSPCQSVARDGKLPKTRSSSSFFVSLEEEEGEGEEQGDEILVTYSSYEVESAVKIQAVWRGYRARRENKEILKDIALNRYQTYFTLMENQIKELNAALIREREVSALYKHMVTNLCKRVKQPSTRVRTTQTAETKLLKHEKHVQTDGLINSLIASFSAINHDGSTSDLSDFDQAFSPPQVTSPPQSTSPRISVSPNSTPFRSAFNDLMIHKKTSPKHESDLSRSRSSSVPNQISPDELATHRSRTCSETAARLIVNGNSLTENGSPTPQLENMNLSNSDTSTNTSPRNSSPPATANANLSFTDTIPCSPKTPSSVTAGIIKNTINMMRSNLFRQSSDSPKQTNLNNSANCSPSTEMRTTLEQFKNVSQLMDEPKNS